MAKLTLSGIIGDDLQPATVTAFLEHNAGSPVDIFLNSPGGSVFDGLEMATAIADHGDVTVRVTALAALAATLLLATAKRVVVAASAMLMLHRASAMTIGNSASHRKSADVLDTIDGQVLDLYGAAIAKRGKAMPMRRLAALLDSEWWPTGEEAVDAGLADTAETAFSEGDAPARASMNFAVDIRNLYQHPPAALFAMLAKETPPMPVTPAPIVVDITADILSRCATAKLSAVEAANIVLKAKGNLDTARDMIIDMAARESGDQPHMQAGQAAGGDEAGHAKALGDAFTAKLKGTSAGPFAGMSVPGLASEFLRARGIKQEKNDNVSIVMQAFGARRPFMASGGGFISTSDLPIILGDSMHKVLVDLFKAADSGVSQVVGYGTMADFRAKSIGKLSHVTGGLPAIEEGGEFTFGSLEEAGESISVGTFGKAISISLQTLVNDNLGAVNRSIRDVSFAAVNLKASLILTAMLEAKMSDGKTLFHSDHANLVSAGPPSIAALSAMRVLMRGQTALDGVTVLGLAPRVILVPSQHETVAQMVTASISPVATEAVNPFANAVTVATEPRLDAIDGDAWFGFDTSMPAIEFDTLDGMPVPVLEVQDPADFSRLGASYRVWWACGAAPIEHRAAIRNSGEEPTA